MRHRARRRPAVSWVGTVVLLLSVVPHATPAPANEPIPEVRTNRIAPTEGSSPIVSMARAGETRTGAFGSALAGAESDLPPLTRAAARLKIEQMSPVRWLSHYGAVSVSQSE